MNKNKFKLDLFVFWTLSIALYWKEKCSETHLFLTSGEILWRHLLNRIYKIYLFSITAHLWSINYAHISSLDKVISTRNNRQYTIKTVGIYTET